MLVTLIIIKIKQDVLDGCAAAGMEPGTFFPVVFWKARAPNKALPTRQNFAAPVENSRKIAQCMYKQKF